MRRGKVIAGSLVLTLALIGRWAWGGIEGSKHDFSDKDWSGGDTCSATRQYQTLIHIVMRESGKPAQRKHDGCTNMYSRALAANGCATQQAE